MSGSLLRRIEQILDPYILLMFATVAFAAVLPAEGFGAIVADDAANAGIVFLFCLYGARLSPRAALDGLRQWKLHLAVLLSTFALFPVLGLGLRAVASAALSPALLTGVIFLCVLPSTVQSSIAFTSIARGNVPAALCAASASNLIGIVLTPVLAGWLLHTHGVQLSFGVFRDIILQLLAPFVAGQLLRPWVGGWVTAHRKVLGYTDRGSILLIIYAAFSKGMAAHVWRQIGLQDLAVLMLALAALLALALFLTWTVGSRLLRFSVEDEIVLQFCGSKKSLASGLPMASVIFAGPQLGLIVLPLMLFHQLQLIVCAFLARRYAARPEREELLAAEAPAA
jgi:sodium/bile acid cotransporter 7